MALHEPNSALLHVEDVHKYYDHGRDAGARAARRECAGGNRRLRRRHGRQWQRQVDADEHPRLPRPSDRGSISARWHRCLGLDKKTLAGIRNGKLGFVFQGFNLIARTTALENTALPTLYTKIDARERRQRASDALALVGLADRAEHYPSQMSGGQQQRVAIARALVNRPSILFADEPTGNLDSRTSIEIMEVFQRLNDAGLTIVMVTHEPDIAQFAKRVIVFRDGRIRRDDVASEQSRASEVLKTLPTLED